MRRIAILISMPRCSWRFSGSRSSPKNLEKCRHSLSRTAQLVPCAASLLADACCPARNVLRQLARRTAGGTCSRAKEVGELQVRCTIVVWPSLVREWELLSLPHPRRLHAHLLSFCYKIGKNFAFWVHLGFPWWASHCFLLGQIWVELSCFLQHNTIAAVFSRL